VIDIDVVKACTATPQTLYDMKKDTLRPIDAPMSSLWTK
jgi:hypothetical protein